MILRKELQQLLESRLKGVLSADKMTQLGADILGLEDQWEEVSLRHLDSKACPVANCLECWLEEQLSQGAEIKLRFKTRGLPHQNAFGH